MLTGDGKVQGDWILLDMFSLWPISDAEIFWYFLPVARAQNLLVSHVWYRPTVGLDSSTDIAGCQDPSSRVPGYQEMTVSQVTDSTGLGKWGPAHCSMQTSFTIQA